jgi:hypothetical protein
MTTDIDTDIEAIVAGEVEHGSELVPYQPRLPATLWGNDPKIALQRMGEVAEALMDVVRSRKLAVSIRGREHLTIEAWTTLGALKGVHAAVVWTRPNETGDGIIARAEARTLDGALVGAAESECSRSERRWKQADPYQVRSMAQTRALSRALQGPLRHVAVLAGYAGAAAEDMADDEPAPSQTASTEPEPGRGKTPPEHQPTRAQVQALNKTMAQLRELAPDTDWAAVAKRAAGAPWPYVTKTVAERVLETLRGHLAELAYPNVND